MYDKLLFRPFAQFLHLGYSTFYQESEVSIIYSASQFLNRLFKTALSMNVTDIHFFPENDKVSIFFRINGSRVFHYDLTLNHYQFIINYLKFTSSMDIGEQRKPQDGALQYPLDHTNLNLRLSTLPTKQNESLAIRILPHQSILSINELLLFNSQATQLKNMVNRTSGVILFTGATGSGKTTLLYSLLDHLLKEKAYQTITLEDPVEKEMTNFLQIQVNESSGLNYNTGLKAALRHDPDILMVGEIRDHKTAEFVFHAAYTGHLVFSTLHAKNAFGTLHRLQEMGIEKVDIIQNLMGVVALELISIKPHEHTSRRAAILEQLNENDIQAYLHDQTLNPLQGKSFYDSRRKAFAYGFSDQTVFETQTSPYINN
ncbi:competence-related pilin export protein ComGA [Pelagirhabdus alkalitolerans]|uniref:Competence-related pilin export protein ComGA n=1 Tax=Pelagirhabdus alkalitolerans TaxID=1612202 RepID=A0A1G6HZ79_9BACI|nr:competence type IV pilus ATPase ComGA [Pelagirhabdus alkalitolerans]SDB99514.1 competence-related pilin export protein ComGA [Pelagirhabdus alkalitolerans]